MKQKGYQVEILDSIYANWERETAKQAMGEFELDKIELLFTNNDDMALGAIDHLHEIGAPASEADIPFNQAFFPIVGVDGTAAGKRRSALAISPAPSSTTPPAKRGSSRRSSRAT